MLIWDTLGLLYFFCRNNQNENTEKVMFYYITFLDFLNSDQGVPTDPMRIKVIPQWPTPPSIRKIWGFHDLTNFYKRFVPYFFILVAPLIELVRNHVPSWKMPMKRVFRPHLKHKFCDPSLPLLQLIFSYLQALIHDFL